jgi:glycosyltransferase involved in cell wall biosynthesis
MTLVSVVIPCHNYGHFLREAIDSALAQTHPDIELIVVDYDSTDDTDRIVAAYSDATYLRRSSQTYGAARNDGLAASGGEFVVFLDADDKLVPDAVESSLACLRARPDCAFAYGHFRPFDVSGPADYRLGGSPGCLDEDDPYSWMLRRNSALRGSGAVLYRRDLLEAVGGYAPELVTAEDIDLNMRLARSHPICCNDRVVLEQRIHESTVSVSRRWRQGLAASVAAQRRQRSFVAEHPQYRADYRNGLRAARGYWGSHLIDETITLLVSGRLRNAARNVMALARWHPAGLLDLVQQAIRRSTLRLRRG